jgi:tRNA threonylcarbamoyladenosine biosynthesis protein TsaE
MEIIFSLSEIDKVAVQILEKKPEKIIVFKGEMGVGKTTLIKQLCKKLGVIENTSSPTFSIVNEYQTIDNHTIYHFDFYRINNENEALNIGVDDYFYSNDWCFIEWAEKIPSLIPENHSIIEINLLENNERKLNFI